jgi:Tol biopolymer transport system component/Zn-dependent M28 family amino/carboxypeptidase
MYRLQHDSFFGMLLLSILLSGATAFPAICQEQVGVEDIVDASPEAAAAREAELVSGVRQLTFDGLRAGEGYFSADGTKMAFQSERDPANPFYQIYVMDLETGDLEKVSPGFGKTTCAWIHPDGGSVLFASTHEDPTSKDQQRTKLEERAAGKESRYAWDYDPNYDLFAFDRASGAYRQLTKEVGYDAEGSYSPDGSQVVFASNRAAYEGELSERERALFKLDPASMVDLYIMNADGANVRRLTSTLGYDGGPFFSPDGKRVCWRRFDENGATAEIFTMRTDGSDVQRLTSLQAMSWAPFYHPSGDYLVFTTNRHGFANFELYLVRADGKGEPVRVTYTSGFDGLPVFTPDGTELAWTTNRTEKKQSQIFKGRWNDQKARELLGLDGSADSDGDVTEDQSAAIAAAAATEDGFSPADIGRHVDYLTRPELAGRLTGTDGERRATAYVAAYLQSLGYEPAGEEGTFFHSFEFPAGAEMTEANTLAAGETTYQLDKDWRPLAFSGSGQFESRGVVFAGYGMVVQEGEDFEGYDSYVHLDVEDKWVLIYRDLPQDIPSETRQQLARFSSARRKAMMARDRGAYGVIFVAGPTSQVKSQLMKFESDASAGGTSIPVISVTNEVAQKWLSGSKESLGELQKSLDDGSLAMGFEIEGVSLAATITIERRTGIGRNVIARLKAQETPSDQVLLIGAHVDHLGVGQSSSSLASGDEPDLIHYGADDNASGVAAMLEIAQYLAAQKRAGKLDMQRDIMVAAWSGEELGLFGSQAFAENYLKLVPGAEQYLLSQATHEGSWEQTEGDAVIDPADPHAGLNLGVLGGHGSSAEAIALYPAIAGYLNLDMVGRLREKLVVQGIGSSPEWAALVQRRNVPVGLELQLDKTSTRLPTDAAVFVGRGVPSLAAFTGAHEDYHTPRDTADKLNYEGATQIARLFALIGRGLVTDAAPIEFKLDEGEQIESEVPRVRLTAYLGTIPDYAGGDLKGVKLSGVGKNGPAEQAGVKAGDVIIELGGRKIENIYDYTYAIEGLKIGEGIKMVVQRDGKEITLDVVPGSRE